MPTNLRSRLAALEQQHGVGPIESTRPRRARLLRLAMILDTRQLDRLRDAAMRDMPLDDEGTRRRAEQVEAAGIPELAGLFFAANGETAEKLRAEIERRFAGLRSD